MRLLAEFVAHGGPVLRIKFSKESDTLFTAGSDSLVQLWSVPAWENIQTIRAHDSAVTCLAVPRSGKLLVTAAMDGGIKIWDLPEGTLKHTLDGHKGPVTDLELSKDGKQVASGSHDGTVRLWSLDSGKESKSHKAPKDRKVYDLAYANHEDLLALALELDQVVVWKMPGASIEAVIPGHQEAVRSVTFSSDDKYLLSADDSGNLYQWDPKTWKLVWKLALETKGAFPADFHPQGGYLAVGAPNHVLLLDAEKGTLMEQIDLPLKGVYCLEFSPDGTYLAAGGEDQKVRIWEVGT